METVADKIWTEFIKWFKRLWWIILILCVLIWGDRFVGCIGDLSNRIAHGASGIDKATDSLQQQGSKIKEKIDKFKK